MLKLLWLLFTMLFETAPGEGDEEEEESDDDDEPDRRDPQARIRALESEKDRHAKNAHRWKRELAKAQAELEARKDGSLSESLKAAKMESAFYRSLLERHEPIDAETAWDLMHARGFVDAVSFSEDGDVEGMDEALDRVLERYPWLLEDGDSSDGDGEPRKRTAPPPKKRQDAAGQAAHQAAGLQQRFPALKSHRKR